MDLHKLSPARLQLQSAIRYYNEAQRAIIDAKRGVELQAAELQKAEEALASHGDQALGIATMIATRAKDRAANKARWHKDGWANEKARERKLKLARDAKQAAEDLVAVHKTALASLQADHDEALREAVRAVIARTRAIENVVAEISSALLARAIAAEEAAAALRAQVMGLDMVRIGVPGTTPRLLLNSNIGANRRIVDFMRTPPAQQAASFEHTAQWRGLIAVLETDPMAQLGDEAVTAAAAAIPRPAPPAMPPDVRWEDGVAARAQAALASQVAPLSPKGVGVGSVNPEPAPKFEDTEAYRAAWKKPPGEPLGGNVPYEQTEAYKNARREIV